jgi:hypothetical protein
MMADTSFTGEHKLQLLEWAALVSKLDAEPGSKQSASLRTQIRGENDYPEVVFTQYWNDRKDADSSSGFGYTQVPPIHETSISRDFAESDGGSVGLSAASVSLLPGEARTIALGPLSEKQREWLKWNREEFQKRGKNPPQPAKEKSK